MAYYNLLDSLSELLNKVAPLLLGIAMVFFLYGLARFILRAGDEREHEKGKQLMIWGIITLTVMVSVWGLVNFIRESVDLNESAPPLPLLEVDNGY